VPIVFLDGVDGAGKSTMINRLEQALTARPVHVAQPLWAYLPPITQPGEFARWVVATPATQVAASLLEANTHRLTALRRRAARAPAGWIALVDRGPKTVSASASAHVATDTTGPGSSPTVADASRRHDTAVTQLAAVEECISVELQVKDYSEITHRLTAEERSNQRYQRYLATFLERFLAGKEGSRVRRLPVDATASLETNIAVVVATLQTFA
jgi:hypothetical protein